jgi:hypothetical protein
LPNAKRVRRNGKKDVKKEIHGIGHRALPLKKEIKPWL